MDIINFLSVFELIRLKKIATTWDLETNSLGTPFFGGDNFCWVEFKKSPPLPLPPPFYISLGANPGGGG